MVGRSRVSQHDERLEGSWRYHLGDSRVVGDMVISYEHQDEDLASQRLLSLHEHASNVRMFFQYD